jgi:predicted Fe-Mo cluster-binding NifX family protein
MRIAIPVETNKAGAAISQKFARSKWFAIWDTQANSFNFLNNPYIEDKLQVGENVVQLLANENVKQFVAYEIGLKLQNIATKQLIQLVLIPYRLKMLKDIIQLLEKN